MGAEVYGEQKMPSFRKLSSNNFVKKNIKNKRINLLNVRRLWIQISAKRKRQLLALLALMVLSSFAEILSIGAIIPLLSVMTGGEALTLPLGISFSGWGEVQQGLPKIFFLFFFVSLVLLSTVIRISMVWLQNNLSFKLGCDLSKKMYSIALHQDYSVHINRNSSFVINAIYSQVGEVIFGTIIPLLSILSSLILLCSIISLLLYINRSVTITLFMAIGLSYSFLIILTKERLRKYSELVASKSKDSIKSMQEGLHGIKDVLINNTQKYYVEWFDETNQHLRKAQSRTLFLSQSPRYIIEGIGVILISLLAYQLVDFEGKNAGAVIPLVGAIVLGLQRMLPLAQLIYSGITNLRGSQKSLEIVLQFIESDQSVSVAVRKNKGINFQKNIRFSGIGYRYQHANKELFRGLDFSIEVGDRVAITGKSGVGKSTLVNILMGLLRPSSGKFIVDGEELSLYDNFEGWRKNIAHVPQEIYISDSSVLENIAFGMPKAIIDREKVARVAKQAALEDLIDGLPLKYDTLVGERGMKFSGGQRQRIGIARALYKDAKIIIFDEATNSLDTDTERNILQTISSLDNKITIIMITHSLNNKSIFTKTIQIA